MNVNEYRTSDLTLITTLSLFFPVKAIDRSNPNKVIFVFDQTDELLEVMGKFWCGEISVEPQAFANQMKNIKTRIYSGD